MLHKTIQRVVTVVFFASHLSMTCAFAQTNFVFFIADDISWNDVGCYGNPMVKTPNIDAMAAEGFRNDNFILTASSCSPSRCSIISGKYPHSNGAPELHMELPESEVPFPLLLKEAGYYTGHAGKWHMGKNAYRAFDIYTDDDKVYDNGDGGEDLWIKFLNERPKDKPFFLWYASWDAHRGWSADDFKVTHHPDSVVVPVYMADTPETRQDIASYYNEIARFDYHIGMVKKELEKQGVLDNTVIIVMADNGRPFPRCKTRLLDSGIKSPLVMYWPNGMGTKGKVSSSLLSSVDIASTVLSIAGVKIPEDYQGVDFSPVLKTPKKLVRQYAYADHNFHDYEAHERLVRTIKYAYIKNARPNLSNCGPADAVRSPSHKALIAARDKNQLTAAQTDVFVMPRPVEELYDLENDPLQLVNIAAMPEMAPVLIEMRQILNNWQIETGDTTPEHISPDKSDRETGLKLNIQWERGTIPGSK